MKIDEETLTAAIDQLRNGEDQLLSDLFSYYRERLKRMVNFRLDPKLRGRVDASDVLQETYLDLAQALERWREHPEMSFFLWLRLMTNQRMTDQYRRHIAAQKRTAAREVSINRAGPRNDTSACIANHLMGNLTSPSQQAIKGERLQKLEQALAEMNPIDREVLALRHFEDLGNNEVAEVLGLQKSAASNRYIRALKRLQEIMADE